MMRNSFSAPIAGLVLSILCSPVGHGADSETPRRQHLDNTISAHSTNLTAIFARKMKETSCAAANGRRMAFLMSTPPENHPEKPDQQKTFPVKNVDHSDPRVFSCIGST